jgi:hypothetical protein
MSSIRSSSAAREGGDDFQHLVAWSRILGALPEQRGLLAVEIEALGVGNVDDVVIRSSNGADEFTQVRYGVDFALPIDVEYLTKSKKTGTSLLTKFHHSWRQLGGATTRPRLQLVTNKLADAKDVLIRNVDGRTGTLGPVLRATAAASDLGRVRAQLADHLGVEETELLALLDDLRLRLGCHYQNEADHAATLMLANGMNHDVNAVRAGIDLVRRWVLDGRRVLDASEVREQIVAAGLIAEEPWATFLIQGIEHNSNAGDAEIAVDFVEHYEGNTPTARRHVHPGAYDDMHAEILGAAESLRATGRQRVIVTGAMRLTTWFAVGAALCEVAGHTVVCGHPAQRWVSDNRATPLPIELHRRTIGTGTAVAVALAFATDPTEDVEAAIREHNLPVSTILTISPPDGKRVADQAEANGYAAAIKHAVRAELREQNGDHVHLFTAVPAGLVLLLGHTWNRVAPTTAWEDLGLDGYTAAFHLDG